MALTTNLISYWKLDEVSGVRVDAVVGSANDLTDNNTVTSAAGIINLAAQFLAANTETLSHVDNVSLEVAGTDFTISHWVKLTDLLATYGVAGKSNGAVAEYCTYVAITTGITHFQTFTGGASQADLAGSAITAGGWHLIVADYTLATKTLTLTVDNGAPASVVNAGTNPTAQAAPFVIGSRTNAFFYTGLVDEVGFWKRILTAPEKTQLYNGGAGLAFPFTSGSKSSKFRIGIGTGI